MSAFDPYHKWLAIPPDEQPPHHYRLLGTGLFETDPDVIDTAAEQRMAYLRTCAGGQHVALSQKLLNEVSAARLCLLNPQKKAAYDAQLQAQLAPPEQESEPEPFAERDEFAGLDGSAGFDGRTSTDADVLAVARPKRRPLGQRTPVAEPPPIGLLVVGGIGVLGVVLLVGGLFAYKMFGARDDVAEGETTDDGEMVIAIDARNRRDPEPPAKTVSNPTTPRPVPPPKQPNPTQPTTTQVVPPSTGPGSTSTDPAPTVAAVPQWIWHGTTAKDCVLRKEFPGGVTFAFLVATADDEMTVFVDGRQVAASRIWSSPFPVDLTPHLAKDRPVHVLQVVGRNADRNAGFVARLVLATPDGRRTEIVSDGTWESAETADAATWSKAHVLAPLTGGPWNEAAYNRALGAQVTRILTSSTIVPQPSGPSGPAANPSRGTLLGSGTAKIDCLPLVDPSRVRRIGRWSRSPDGRGLTGTNGETQGSIAVEVPVAVDGNYSVAVRFRRGGRDKVFLQLPVGASVVHAYLDGMLSRLGGRSGLDRIDGREYSDNPSTVNGPRLPDGSASVVATVAVRGDAATIVVGVEGRGEVIRWSGPVSSLSVDPASIVPRGNVLAVAAGPDCKGIEVESMVLELQGGTAYATAPGSPPSVGPSPSDPSPVVPGGTNLPVPVVERGKVPEGTALRQAEARVQDVFGTDFAGAKKPDEKRALGRKLLTQAETSTDAERDVRYVLYRRSRELAVETGDVSTAVDAVRRLERHFDFDAAALRTETLVALARTADATRDVEALARASLDAAESLLAASDLDPADRLLLLVTGALRKFRSPSLVARQAALRTRHTEKKAAFAAADAARKTLESKPDDPAANLAWGLFLCGAKQDWDAGLTRLAKSGDADLAKIVELERAAAPGTAASTDPAEPLRLADAWWDWIEKSPAERRPLRTAAHYWYLRARPAASGLDRVKIDRRLLEIGTPSPPRRWPVP